VYADIIRGKLDQRNQQLEVDYAIGRDILPEAIPNIVKILEEWCTSCDTTLQDINEQVAKANKKKEM
jgi:COP9 signalosome complex subunit 7